MRVGLSYDRLRFSPRSTIWFILSVSLLLGLKITNFFLSSIYLSLSGSRSRSRSRDLDLSTYLHIPIAEAEADADADADADGSVDVFLLYHTHSLTAGVDTHHILVCMS
jgi:hypothetical protein